MKSFKAVSETKKKKTHQEKRLIFNTQFKIEFLLPFTGCREVLGKMPDKQKQTDRKRDRQIDSTEVSVCMRKSGTKITKINDVLFYKKNATNDTK